MKRSDDICLSPWIQSCLKFQWHYTLLKLPFLLRWFVWVPIAYNSASLITNGMVCAISRLRTWSWWNWSGDSVGLLTIVEWEVRNPVTWYQVSWLNDLLFYLGFGSCIHPRWRFQGHPGQISGCCSILASHPRLLVRSRKSICFPAIRAKA